MRKLKRAIYADVWRIYGRANVLLLLKAFIFKLTFRPILTYRIYKYLVTQPKVFGYLLIPPVKLLHHLFSAIASISLPLQSVVGSGLLFVHGFGIVINSKAKLGKNVTLFHCNTIGETRRGATIGAAAVVMKDVKPLEIVVGNPQKVLKVENSPRTPNPAPDYLLN